MRNIMPGIPIVTLSGMSPHTPAAHATTNTRGTSGQNQDIERKTGEGMSEAGHSPQGQAASEDPKVSDEGNSRNAYRPVRRGDGWREMVRQSLGYGFL
jgi:hypothetical protein